MHRTVRSIVLAGALSALGASACLAQKPPPPQPPPREDVLSPRTDAGREYAKGVAAIKAKRYQDAVRAFGVVTDAAPADAGAWRLLGAAYAGEQRWPASRQAYRRALNLAPDDIASHAGLAVALVALKDPQAQEQAQWLKARTEACNNSCPEAALLQALQTRGPFAAAAPE